MELTNGEWRRKLHQVKNLALQYVSPPDVAVIGSVHRNNVGDMALSRSVQEVLSDYHVCSGAQRIGGGGLGLAHWPFVDKAVVAGGAIGRENILQTVVRKYSGNPEDVSYTGISFWSIDNLSDETISFLSKSRYVSCRNRKDADRLRSIGVNCVFSPDNAFSLPVREQKSTKGKIGVNVVPRYMKKKNKKYVPSEKRPSFAKSYVNTVRCVVSSYLSRGWRVEHIPFTPNDYILSRQIFRDTNVRCTKYTPEVYKLMRKMSRFSRFIATRFHAHVFALKYRIPLYSISYAPKCSNLGQQLQIPNSLQATRNDIENHADQVVDWFTNQRGFVIKRDTLQSIEESSRNSIRSAVQAIRI